MTNVYSPFKGEETIIIATRSNELSFCHYHQVILRDGESCYTCDYEIENAVPTEPCLSDCGCPECSES